LKLLFTKNLKPCKNIKFDVSFIEIVSCGLETTTALIVKLPLKIKIIVFQTSLQRVGVHIDADSQYFNE
jgi:hypothetical protein